MRYPVRQVVRATVDLALPRRCAGCDVPGCGVCRLCRSRVTALHARAPFAVAAEAGVCTWAKADYEGPLSAMLRAYKDHERADLCALLAPLLRDSIASALDAAALAGSGLGAAVIVPVPTSARARRRRGRDPLADLSNRALVGQGVLPLCPILRVRRRVRDQAGLSARERAHNLNGALRVRPGVRLDGVHCIVVDDIVTTGATIGDAARALALAGAAEVSAAVVAATQLHR